MLIYDATTDASTQVLITYELSNDTRLLNTAPTLSNTSQQMQTSTRAYYEHHTKVSTHTERARKHHITQGQSTRMCWAHVIAERM